MKSQNIQIGQETDYSTFDQIDGQHSFKKVVPDGFVDYPVRKRHGGEIFYFNFALAREMGLLPQNHPDELTRELKEKLLDTFALVIINEYDVNHGLVVQPEDRKPHPYMATRYLQLQHPGKRGQTSGDGRGIWNGEFKHQGITWDISSSGTGATCLSPAHAQTKTFFKTGDRKVGYGNGYNCVEDGLSAALMSESFHHAQVATERTLVIIEFERGSSINVRAGKNLFRPAHFFRLLKLNQRESLRAMVEYFVKRQQANGEWPRTPAGETTYAYFSRQISLIFSKIAAQYEAEYIFCWLDWDGDNILADGGIIDYGSVRQFGLFHREYRYDDVERMSTNIPEQRIKARYIVQNFAQIFDYLNTGKKRKLSKFKHHLFLKQFDRNFKRELKVRLLQKLGLSSAQTEYALKYASVLVDSIKKLHAYFESAQTKQGIFKIEDGVTSNAIFCMSHLHRELPRHYAQSESPLNADEFISLIKSSYARPIDLQITSYRRDHIREFQKQYLKLVTLISRQFHGAKVKRTLLEMTMRASLQNRPDRLTGDGVLQITSNLIRNPAKLDFAQKHVVIEQILNHQRGLVPALHPQSKVAANVEKNLKAVKLYREGF